MIVVKEIGYSLYTDPTVEGTEPSLNSILLTENSQNVFLQGPLEEAGHLYPQVVHPGRSPQPCRGPGCWSIGALGITW